MVRDAALSRGSLYYRDPLSFDRSERNDLLRARTRSRSPIVGSSAPKPQGLLVSKIAVGSSSDPDG
jgi:hypothetical protein